MSLDSVLSCIGEFGPYQKRILVYSVIIGMPVAIQATLTVFTLGVPDFRCAIPGLHNDSYEVQNHFHAQLLNASVPYDDRRRKYSECHVWTSSRNAANNTLTGLPSALNGEHNGTTEKCSSWVYSREVFTSSLVTDLDLVCDRLIFTTHANMMTMSGFMIASLFGGLMSDAFGRKPVMLASMFLTCVGSITLIFVKSVPALLALRFVVSTVCFSYYISGYVLCTELVGPSKRAMAGVLSTIGWAFGVIVLGFVAYLVRDWINLQLILSCPLLLLLLSWWLLPESPRWLLNKGRNEEAAQILINMAKINKVELPENILPKAMETTNNSNHAPKDAGAKGSLLLILKSRVLIVRFSFFLTTVVLAAGKTAAAAASAVAAASAAGAAYAAAAAGAACAAAAAEVAIAAAADLMVCSMVYYGLTLNVGSITEGDLYLNFILMTVMEVTSLILTIFLLGKIGRKTLYCCSVLLGGLACLASVIPVLTETDAEWINTVVSSIGKFGIAASFSIVWLFTMELIPTVIRNTGIGACSVVARMGGILAPYIGNLHNIIGGHTGKSLPLIIFGGSAVLAGILALYLPETGHRKLPETVADAEQIRRKKCKNIQDPDM